MSFSRPDLQALISRAQADIESRLPGADPKLRRSLVSILARVNAGGMHGLYGYLEWLSKQVIIDTADAEHLSRQAAIWGVARKGSSTAAGVATLQGQDGSTVPTSTTLQRGDGAEYTVQADVEVVAGVATAQVAADQAGAAGNCDAGVKLQLVSPVPGVQSVATVDSGGLTGGADAESDDSLRARLLDRIRRQPHGGAQHDYERWALEVPGVTRVWVRPRLLGAATVLIYVVDDDADPIIPGQAVLDAVVAHIEELRPVTAEVHVHAPMPTPLDMTIRVTPNTTEVRAAVVAELTDLLAREAEPGGTILLSHIREAVSVAGGEADHVVTVPSADVAMGTGEIAVLGNITWSSL